MVLFIFSSSYFNFPLLGWSAFLTTQADYHTIFIRISPSKGFCQPSYPPAQLNPDTVQFSAPKGVAGIYLSGRLWSYIYLYHQLGSTAVDYQPDFSPTRLIPSG